MHNRNLAVQKVSGFSLTFLLAAALVLLSGCGGKSTTSAATAGVITSAASISLSSNPTSIKTDNTAAAIVTLTTLNATNAAVSGVPVTLTASTGILSTPSVTTDATGVATFTFSSGTSSKSNRAATINAVAGGVTGALVIQIDGSTLTANPTTGITIPDNGANPATVTFTAKDAGGNVVSGTPVTLVASGTGKIAFTPASGTTDTNGQLVVTVTGVAGGTGAATLTATALGTTASANITVSSAGSTFAISGLSLNGTALTSANTNSFSNTAMKTGDSLAVTVTAPSPTTEVAFVSTMGSWVGGTNVKAVSTVAGTAMATLNTAAAGLDNIQVIDNNLLNPRVSDTLSVSMTAVTSNSITLQATPSTVPKSVGTTTGVSSLIATVKDLNGLPVGGAPVAFSILNPTGGSETVSPAVAYTASTAGNGLSLGQALTTFTSGSLTSGQTGIKIHAQVLGTSVATEATGVNLTASGNDAAVIVGGQAGSMTFSQATSLGVTDTGTGYKLAMSVFVADSGGNPAPLGTQVNLSLWPIAWSTGSGCVPDADGGYWNKTVAPYVWVTANMGTFLSEDTNENLVLDTIPPEDGTRTYYYGNTVATPVVGTLATKDTYITPPNSAAGTLPATVNTDINGMANFDLYYPKSSAIWIVARLRAKALVAGSDAVGEVQFRLPALEADANPCRLPPSPYNF